MVDVVGKDPAIKKRVTCRECSSILKYVPSEVREVGDAQPVALNAVEIDMIRHGDMIGSALGAKIIAALDAERQKREAAERERDDYRRMFDECAVARDASGFLGTVPQCIEHWSRSYEAAEASLAKAIQERDEARQAVDAFADICDELGVERDNEAGLIAAHELVAELASFKAAAEGNEAEAPAPKPDPAIAELVEQIIAGNGPIGKWVGSIDYSTYEGFEKYLEVQLREALHLKASLDKKRDNDAVSESLATFVDGKSGAIEEALATFRTVRARETAALTASNDRVAELELELERERDDG